MSAQRINRFRDMDYNVRAGKYGSPKSCGSKRVKQNGTRGHRSESQAQLKKKRKNKEKTISMKSAS